MQDTSPPSPSLEGRILWEPSQSLRDTCRMKGYIDWLRSEGMGDFGDYASLWQFSVTETRHFWASLWDYFQLGPRGQQVLSRLQPLPVSGWFPEARLNYAERLVRGPSTDRAADPTVLVGVTETGRTELTRGQLAARVASCRRALEELGVQPGDRVVAYLTNRWEAVVALLASASLGAVWASCPPEFGVRAVLDRFQQIEPTVLFYQTEYTYGGKAYARGDDVRQILAALPTLKGTIAVGAPLTGSSLPSYEFQELLRRPAEERYESLPFEHPLWVLFSSGTTGLPKAIVHGHGGMLLEHLKVLAFHHDLGPGDCFFWFSTTGWMMWNYLLGGMAVGARILLYDGSPALDDMSRLWTLVEQERITCFGVSAPYLMACRARGLSPTRVADVSSIQSIGSTGAPLPVEGFEWVYEQLPDVWLASASGGTDLCTAFLAGCPLLPVRSGQLSCATLGARVESFDDAGSPQLGKRGELVLTRPMPCMPLGFWNDPSGARYRRSYFEHFPGVWRHGDWVTLLPSGGAVISGRSDATLNRGGVRMGTSDFYRIVEEQAGVVDSLVVDTSGPNTAGELYLFLVLQAGAELDVGLQRSLQQAIRTQLSPRHVPDRMIQIAEVPRTASGKKLEVPVKRILNGEPVEQVAHRGALKNPQALDDLLARLRGPDAQRS